MSDIKALLENEVLSEETKGALDEAIRENIQAVKEEAVEEAKNELEVKYATKFQEEKQSLAEKTYSMVNELVKEEFEELKEDVEHYKNLEVDYAKRLNEFKESYKQELAENFNEAVKQQVQEEFSELKEDIEEAKKATLGRRIYEAFAEEFQAYGLNEDDQQIRNELKESKDAIAEKDRQIEELQREKTMESLLSNLEGQSREIMHSILENTDTAKLEEKYNSVIDRVINESDKGDDKNLSEGADEDADKGDKGGKIVNENSDQDEEIDPDWSRTLALATGGRRRKR